MIEFLTEYFIHLSYFLRERWVDVLILVVVTPLVYYSIYFRILIEVYARKCRRRKGKM